jgi:tRNA pseudouridine32 synthase/23S rRNA pseudouridine746 synthase
MSLSRYPSKLSLPRDDSGIASVLEYLVVRFPNIEPAIWKQRVADGKVHWHDGSPVTAESACRSQQRVYYYREVESEPVVPFAEQVLFEDEHLLVADKPHFLPVTPGGIHVNECLQNRLRNKTGKEGLQALHRLDRATAGLVLFSVNPDTRHLYHDLFSTHKIQKTYQAIATVNAGERLAGRQWVVKNRLVKADPRFLMMIVEGAVNSHSVIRCRQQFRDKALFELQPITGKTHQLRLHMQALGWPLLNDSYYPTLQTKGADIYSSPLQLLAKELRFIDPVTQQSRVFISDKNLRLDTKYSNTS